MPDAQNRGFFCRSLMAESHSKTLYLQLMRSAQAALENHLGGFLICRRAIQACAIYS